MCNFIQYKKKIIFLLNYNVDNLNRETIREKLYQTKYNNTHLKFTQIPFLFRE